MFSDDLTSPALFLHPRLSLKSKQLNCLFSNSLVILPRMLPAAKKIIYLCQRDGFYYTFKRAMALFTAHSPLAYRLSFSYTKNTRLAFAPALLVYSIFADRQTRHTDVDLIKKYTPAGGTMLDVGGNIGSITIPLAQRCRETLLSRLLTPYPISLS